MRLAVLTRDEVLAGALDRSWDESACAARLTPEKLHALATNPSSTFGTEPMQIIGLRGNRVIGRIDLVAADIEFQNGQGVATEKMLWGSNLFVPVEERKSMMGVMLVMKASAVCALVGAHGPSQLATPLYEKLRFQSVPLDRFILLRRSRSIVARYLGKGPVGAVARVGADLGLVGLRAANRLRTIGHGFRLRRLPAMPAEFETAIARTPWPDGCAARASRSVAIINWLLANRFESTHRHDRALFLVESPRGSALGYIVMKVKFHESATHRAFPNLTLASLADWGSFDPTVPIDPYVIPAAIQASGMLESDALEVCLQASDRARLSLRGYGFVAAGTMRGMWKASPKSPLNAPRFADPNAWSLRYGDGDNTLG